MTLLGTDSADFDWEHIRETVKLLAVSVAQLEGSLKVGGESVAVLANSFTSMAEDMSAIQATLLSLQPCHLQKEALQYCAATQEKIHASVIAFQFYDRLQQCLRNVSLGLQGLSALVEAQDRRYNLAEWQQLQAEIRGRYTSETEKIMFDAIVQGKSIQETLALATESEKVAYEGDIELF